MARGNSIFGPKRVICFDTVLYCTVIAILNCTILCVSLHLPLVPWVGGRVSGHCLIWASGTLPPKHRNILGCFDFSKKKFCQKKCTLTWSNHFLKIQCITHILNFLNIDQNSSKNLNINMDIFILNLLSVWSLSEVQNWFQKQIWNENFHISI